MTSDDWNPGKLKGPCGWFRADCRWCCPYRDGEPVGLLGMDHAEHNGWRLWLWAAKHPIRALKALGVEVDG